MKNGKIKVALAGLGFGGAFAPIYIKHPDVYALDLIEPEAQTRLFWEKHLPINHSWSSLEDALKDDTIDAVHLVTPIPMHARQSLQVLYAGKHCACTVPAAVTNEDLFALVKAEAETKRNYMMMETAVYTFACLAVQKMYRQNQFGRIQLMRGCHYQDMENWPEYWMGLPPMHYATHAVSPLLKIADTRATHVICFGSGEMRPELSGQYHNPYPAEIALFQLQNHPAMLEITRTLFETAREYCEGFSIYGSARSFEWNNSQYQLQAYGPKTKRRGIPVIAETADFPDTGDLLPPEIGRFTVPGDFDDTNPQKNFKAGGGHHGSHPHLVHEFVRSIIEKRRAAIDSIRAAEWTSPGITAHLSAMKNGARLDVPDFR